MNKFIAAVIVSAIVGLLCYPPMSSNAIPSQKSTTLCEKDTTLKDSIAIKLEAIKTNLATAKKYNQRFAKKKD